MFARPGSLTTQLALVMSIAVLTAAAAQLAVLLVERNRTGLIEVSGPAITRFADMSSEAINSNARAIADQDARSFRRRGARILIDEHNLVGVRNLNRQRQLERRLQRAMEELGHPDLSVMAATRIIGLSDLDPNGIRPLGQRGPPRGPERSTEPERKVREIVLASQIAPNRWISGVFLAPVPPNDEFARLFFGALVAVGCVLGAAIWMSTRLVRPLTELASAAGELGSASTPQEIPVRGPAEIRNTLSAFNTMSARVSHLLREKDVMLGALGHDLRTPLASLRIRIESMEPAAEREKAINTIEETTRLLESILDFARAGQANKTLQEIDLAGLIQDITDDYRSRGANIDASVSPASIRQPTNPDLIRRLLRNLVDNALRHAETVRMEIKQEPDSTTVISVADDGPGIPEDQLALVKEPFYRGDASRNRQHGGAGLGLALADTIARALGGELVISNRKPSGLLATVTLPSSGANIHRMN